MAKYIKVSDLRRLKISLIKTGNFVTDFVWGAFKARLITVAVNELREVK